MTVHLRPARAADDRALREVDLATWSSVTSPGPAPDPRRGFFTDDRGPGGFLVAEIGDRVVGYVGLHQWIDLPSHAHVLTIDGLAVLPSARGVGVGRALVQAALKRAVGLGARKVTLRVLAPNHAARALYAGCGFTEEGVLRGEFHLDGQDVDDVLMAWRRAAAR